MKPAPAYMALLAAGALALGARTLGVAAGSPLELPARPAPEPAPEAPGDRLLRADHDEGRPRSPTSTSLERPSPARRAALERVVLSLSHRLGAGDCGADFDRQARLSAEALVQRHGLPHPDSLGPWLEDPDSAPAAAVLAGHLGWTALPPSALGALGALWNDARVEGAGEGFAEADAAFARALAVAPALYRFEGPARRDALLGALVDPVPQRRRLARVAAASADPVDAARRLTRLAHHVVGVEVEAERLCIALRQCLDRVPAPDDLDALTLEIARERADAWSRSPALAGRSAALRRSLARFPR